MHPVTGAELIKGGRRSKKSTSALGKLNRTGRHPIGPLGTENAFTRSAKREAAPTKPARLSRADAAAIAKARKAKRPTKAQKELLGAAEVRKAAGNARRSSTLKASHARAKKMAGHAAAGKVQSGKYVPRGPLG